MPTDPTAGKGHDGLRAPVRPVLGGRGEPRQRAGLVAVAVVAIAVVAAGIGFSGRTSEEAEPSTSTPSSSAGSPSASGPEATGGVALGCTLADPEAPPEPLLRASVRGDEPVTGDVPPWAGQPGATAAGTWPEPGRDHGLNLGPAASLVLAADDETCIRSASAEYLPLDQLDATPWPLGRGSEILPKPRARLVLGSPPPGEWVVRLLAGFATGPGEGETILIERFFRVKLEPDPWAPPRATPAVACGAPDTRGPVGLAIVAADREPVPGGEMVREIGAVKVPGSEVTAAYSEAVMLIVDDDVCATSWLLEWLDPTTGETTYSTGPDNPTQNPYVVSQNRIELLPPSGRTVLVATVNFGLQLTTRTAWEMTYSGPPIPAVTFVAADGSSVPGVPGCGTSWWFSDDDYRWEACGAFVLPAGTGTLTIDGGEIVRLDVPGSEVQGWYGVCGPADRPDTVWEGRCSTGSGSTAPILFLAPPGRSVVGINVTLSGNGPMVSATYFVLIEAGP